MTTPLMPSLASVVLLHGGDGHIDLIYFWSSILIVLLPLSVFITLTYLLVKAYRNRERGAGGGT